MDAVRKKRLISRKFQPLCKLGFADLTIPEKPQSRIENLRITEKGEQAFPEPLRKRRADKTLYSRPPIIESSITRLLLLPVKVIAERASIGDPQSPDYIPSECLLYFLRQARESEETADFRELFVLLRQRIIAATPAIALKIPGNSKRAIKAVGADVREAVLDAFIELLCKDRNDYDDRLDYFEIRFNSALARLRLTARRKVLRAQARVEPLMSGAETNAPSIEVEIALAKLKGTTGDEIPDFLFRSRLLAAINSLPADEKRVIELILWDFLIHSTDPEVFTISKALGCSEKTVRNRRDRALARLRAELQEEKGHE